MTTTKQIQVTYEYSGHSDYWGGNGKRWDDNAGCLFAFYGPDTTLRECVDQWVDDYEMGGDCDNFPGEISGEEIREAILESLTPKGMEDYESSTLCEQATNADWEGYDPENDESPIYIILVEVM